MKNIKIKPSENWHPLITEYEHSDDVDFNNTQITSLEGITLNINTLTDKVVDVSHNNYTSTQLTTRSTIDSILTPKIISDKYPEQFTTHIICRGYPSIGSDSRYLKILPTVIEQPTREYIAGVSVTDPNQSSWFMTQDLDDNYIYFNITIYSDTELCISHNDNINTVFLTRDANGTITFEESPGDIPTSFQKFNYIIEPENGAMVILANISGKNQYLSLASTGVLSFIDVNPGETAFPQTSIFKFIPYIKSSKNIYLDNNWVSYSTMGNQNNLNINRGKSYKNLFNNYLLTTQYTQISSNKIHVDITPLKNQLTSGYNQSRGYPFQDARACDIREYSKIFSGTNQIKGLDDIYIGFNDYTTDITLSPDEITYFHTPQDMYPFDKININDSGLVDGGAIGGDTPIVSDKIFKKAADYKYSSPDGAPSDEETGIWLCSWLKTNIGSDWDSTVSYKKDIIINHKDQTYVALIENSNIIPGTDKTVWEEQQSKSIWVDRYYNPNRYTATEALKVENQYNTYSSKYDYVIGALSAENHYVFDKVSDLVFEPGCRYAYYRVGDRENASIINTNKDSLIHAGIDPTYNNDRTEQINTTDYVAFDSTKFIQTKTRDHTDNSSFTLSFWMSQEDWTKPIGAQIVGNYTNRGFGVFNREHVTPYIIIPTASGQRVYNTDFEDVLNSTIPVTGHCSSLGMNENIHTLTKESNEWYIKQHDKKNLLVESTSLSGIIDNTEILTDIIVHSDSIYIANDSGMIYKFDIDNEYQDLLTNNLPSSIQPPGTPIQVCNPRLGFYGDQIKPVYADTFTVDMSGNTWYLSDGKIYENITGSQLGFPASFDDYINNSRVAIIAEESVMGVDGNSITVTGDGTSTVSTLIMNWNAVHSANMARIITGHGVIPDNGEIIQLTGGINAANSTTISALECSSGHIISVRSDYDNNIWSLCSDSPWDPGHVADGNNIKIFKLTNKREIIIGKTLGDIDSSLTDITGGHFYMDIISEFNSTGYTNYILILQHQPLSSDFNIIKIDMDGNFISHVQKSLPELADVDITALHDITGFESNKHRNLNRIHNNTLTFKLRFENYFDKDKTYVSNIHTDASKLSPGYHHFAYSFNSTTSNISLYIDGDLTGIATSDDANQAAAYKFSETINTPFIVGATPFFNNVLLAEHLDQESYYFTPSGSVKDIKVYNDSLNYFKVRSLTREHNKIEPIKLTLPTGGRTYLDHITKFFKHRKPGHKSNEFNINIIAPPALSGSNLRGQVEDRLKVELTSHIPTNTNINKINWI